MLKKFKMNEIVFDDQITLLKPLGYNYVSFYHQNLKILVIFHPALKAIVKSFKVQDVHDYQFRDDRKYFYTTNDESIRIYQIQDDNCFLLCDHHIKPIGFQWNYILCMREIQPNSSSEDENYKYYDSSHDDSCDDSCDDPYDKSYESYQDNFSDSSYSDYIELSLIELSGSQIQCNYRIKDSQQDQWSVLEKFYLLIQEDTKEYLPYQYYHVMINNKTQIKFHVSCDEIVDNNQLKQSNYYLTRIISDDECLLVMTKQQQNCKIIRKIRLQDGNSDEKLIYNYRQVLQYINPESINQVQLINLWNLQKQNVRIESFENIILTKNNNMLVASEKNCLKLFKMY